MNTKIGIISINWNNYKDTKEFIDSIINSDLKLYKYKIYIVDNSSTDDSLLKLNNDFRENENIKFIENSKNLGFAKGNNIGLQEALKDNCDLCLIINNDTVVDSNFISPLIEKIYINDKIGVAAGKIYYYNDKKILWSIGGELKLVTASARYYGNDEIDTGQYDNIKELGIASGCFMLVKSDVLKKCGFLSDKFFFRGEEWEFAYRIRKNGYRIAFVPESYIYHKVSRSHERFSYYDIYSAYRGKLIFANTYMPKPIWLLWVVLFGIYSSTFSYWRFKKSAKIDFKKYSAMIRKVLIDGINRDFVSLEDIEYIKRNIDNK